MIGRFIHRRSLLCVVAMLLLLCPVRRCPAGEPTPYLRACALLEADKQDEARAVMESVASRDKMIDINAAVLIVSDKELDSMAGEVRKYLFPDPSEPGTVLVAMDEVDDSGQQIAARAAPRSTEQVSLVHDILRRITGGAVVSVFGMRVADSQRAHISLVPDREFPLLGPDGKQQYQIVRRSGRFLKVPATVRRTICFAVRPMVGDGGELWIQFSDAARSEDPYPSASLSQKLPWNYPGKPKVKLGPPEFKWRVAPKHTSLMRLPDSGNLMICDISVPYAVETKESVPVLDMIPVVDQFFTKSKTTHEKAGIYVILEFKPASGAHK